MTSPRVRPLALAVAATATALVLAACGDEPSSSADDPGDGATDASSPSEPATSEPAPTETSEAGGPETVTVPVYFVGDAPDGPRLYREFRKVESDNPMEEAVALLLAGDALDPDYRSPLPDGGTVGDIHFDGIGEDGVVQVVLGDDSLTQRPAGMSKREAQIAVQSMVYTLQGVVQARARMVVMLDGQPTTLLGIDTSQGVKNAPDLDVLNLVNVTTPEEGATVSGSFTASGIGSSFEATIPWQIRQRDRVVKKGFATAEGWMERVYPWETEVDVSDLAPGEYVFAAMTDDPSGGAEGFGPSEDTKTITVE